jgi:two-component system CheB/CheR fusion protein
MELIKLRPVTNAKHVLVVEDHPDGREALCRLLRLIGHKVGSAATGPEGVALALQSPPDVVLIDLNLPGMNGLEVAQRLRQELGRSVVLVACTAYEGPQMNQLIDEAGFDGHVVKPADLADFAPWLADGASAPTKRARFCPSARFT